MSGRLTRNYDKEKLKTTLLTMMKNNENRKVKSAGERVKTWIKRIKDKK